MYGVLATFFVVSLVLTAVDGECTASICGKEWTSLAYKKESDNLCYFYQYAMKLDQKDSKDPLRNLVPLNSYLIDCVDSPDVIGMNIVNLGAIEDQIVSGNLAVCFYMKNNQQVSCYVMEKENRFVKLFTTECAGVDMKTGPLYFYIFYSEHFEHYAITINRCHLFFKIKTQKVVLEDKACQDPAAQWDPLVMRAIGGENSKYFFTLGNYFICGDDNRTFAVHLQKDDSNVGTFVSKNDYQFMFVDNQWYEDVRRNIKVFFPDSPVSILGLKYFEDPLNSSNCMVIAENSTRDKSVYMAGVPCHANRLASGFNIEWNVNSQTAYIRACFVYRSDDKVKLQCHLTNDKGSKTDVDFDFVECQDHLSTGKIMSVTVGDLQRPTDGFNYVLISTETKTCKVTADIITEYFTDALKKELESFSFDPVLVEKISFANLDDVLTERMTGQIFHRFNGNTFARINATEWAIDWKTKTDSTVNGKIGGKYDYLIEEIHIVTLKLMTKGTKNAQPPRQIMTWSCTVYDNVQPGESCLDVKRRRNAAPQPVGAIDLVVAAVLIRPLLG